jgi:hypothetical protein
MGKNQWVVRHGDGRAQRSEGNAGSRTATHKEVAELEARIWAVMEDEMPERAAVTEAAAGGRLRPDGPLQSPTEIHHRLEVLDTVLTQLIEEG